MDVRYEEIVKNTSVVERSLDGQPEAMLPCRHMKKDASQELSSVECEFQYLLNTKWTDLFPIKSVQ